MQNYIGCTRYLKNLKRCKEKERKGGREARKKNADVKGRGARPCIDARLHQDPLCRSQPEGRALPVGEDNAVTLGTDEVGASETSTWEEVVEKPLLF